jgi:subtilisin family serine protease
MRPLLRLPVPTVASVLLLAALAACDQRPTEPAAAASAGQAGMAPLLMAGPDALPDRYVVVMKDGVTTAASVARQAVQSGGKVHYVYSKSINGFAASLPAAAVDALRRNPQVQYVAQDAMAYPTQVEPAAVQNGATWGLDRIDQRALPLNTTYVYTRTGAGVRVYVIDTGILTTHTEFGTRASVGTDFVADGLNGQDCNGHGTHVAGTIAGTTYGVAKAAQVIAVRVFGCTGGAAFSTIIAAVDWITANAQKPAVTNMSLSGGVYTPLNQAVQASIASGVVYAVAAGNDNSDACQLSPASTPEALTVAATASNDGRSSFSNYGTCVDLFAPGTSITSAWWTSTTATNTISGTSMATPHVAGVAALYLQGSPAATPATVHAQIVATSSFGRVTDVVGSPNRLLFSGLTAEPPIALATLAPASLAFTFVRPVPGAAALIAAAEPTWAGARQAFQAGSDGASKVGTAGAGPDAAVGTAGVLTRNLTLGSTGNTLLNWSTASNHPWLSVSPPDGALSPGYQAVLGASVNDATLAPGTHNGAITLSGAANSPLTVNVTVTVLEGLVLQVGIPRTGQAGASGSQRYFIVTVPSGLPNLTISTAGGTGDVDLRVAYGRPPTNSDYDCSSAGGTNNDSCNVLSPRGGTYWVLLYGFNTYSGATLSATAGGVPAAPAGITALANTTSSIRVSWADSSVNETGFTVTRRSMPPGGAWSGWTTVGAPGANAVGFTNTGLVASTTYQYRVRACNATGCSAWAMTPTVAIPTAAPAAPFALTAAATSGTIAVLAWWDGSSDEGAFTLTRALRNLDGTWGPYATVSSTLPANGTGYTNPGLTAGRQYRWQLRACNVAGCSAFITSPVLVMPSIPTAPSAVTATALSATQVRVQWTDGSPNESSFTLARAAVNGAVIGNYAEVARLPANTVLFNNAGLTSARTYSYRIRSCNLAGCSAWVLSPNVTTP